MRYMLALAGLIALAPSLQAETIHAQSPNGAIQVELNDEQGQPSYSISLSQKVVISPSNLGLVFKNQGEFGKDFIITHVSRSESGSQWQQPWGERRLIEDQHVQVVATFNHPKKGHFNLWLKVFNDGIGFRYEIPTQKGLQQLIVTDELTEFVIAEPAHAEALWIPARGWNRYEYLYQRTTFDAIDRVHTPFTFKLASGTHVSIHEAALTDYAAMTLDQRRPGTLKADLTPWSDGTKVKTQAGFFSPWRTIQISKNATGLLNSDLILNLNEPNKLGDVSWVKPGKYVGIWWGMHLGVNTWGSGTKHGATTENTKALIDFAASNGFDGVLVEGWNQGWDGDWFHNGDVFSFTKSYPDFDIKEITQYGAAKNVKLIGHHETSGNVTNYRKQMPAALDLYAVHGVSQIKTGYVADGGNIKRVDEKGLVRKEWHDGQFMVNEYLFNITEAAKRKISINTHEPIKDTGLRRTYPNWISREGARGQEFNAWGSPPNPPEHEVNLAFTRMLAGPMDYTPGIFNLAWQGLDAENRVQTTLAKQLALYVVLYSPIQMAADLPENYLAKPEAFQFIKDVVTDWDQSIALAAEFGEYVAFARKDRHSSDWFLGGITNATARELTLDLTFLDMNKNYEITLYQDGEKANWRTNPYDIVIERRKVKARDTLTLALASSGGFAARIVELADE
ncbi:glycoside hydrolase family 97 protein [Simiduia curdlanivorans]|uniref:Glycoside hydrolase family 97 protein n=1 Tax=Simiduia curdlanivorans TaxID=1492769 RepID=A0ABV8V4Q7_9GAMM|nr:glycoside hydrolase family 97 protein [Simiduia curdlanivorans]MDN3638223.1 glycoside hydrolase family 97 protein [Simiduia curdlanivorans]